MNGGWKEDIEWLLNLIQNLLQNYWLNDMLVIWLGIYKKLEKKQNWKLMIG